MVRAWAHDRAVGAELFDVLNVPGDGPLRTKAGTVRGESSLIYLVEEQVASYSNVNEPWEAFAAALETRLTAAATWLDQRPAGAFGRLAAAGINADILVDAWIDQNQFDLELPAVFVRACGSAGLAIAVVTND